ncbi:MAG: 30S ribosomal protein S2 [bacterium]|nr:30S ribosomal protein S2 [bacterium]
MASQDISMRELLEVGSHFGHQSRRWNPKMKPYIYQTRDQVHVIDLAQTAQGLKEACDYVRDLVAAGGKVLFVGTKKQAKDIIKVAASDAGMPYITERWVGGMLTNWDTIQKNIQRMLKWQKQIATGELDHYTKKEQSLITKELNRLTSIYEGLVGLDTVPDAVFIVDVRKEKIAVKESFRRKMSIIGVCDTNSDPSLVDIVIPANDDAHKSVEYIVTKIAEAAKSGSMKSKDPDMVDKKMDVDEVKEKKPRKKKVEDTEK